MLSPTGSGSLVEFDSHREQVRLSTQIRTRSHDVIKSTIKIVLDSFPAAPPPLPKGCDTFLSKPRLTWALIFDKETRAEDSRDCALHKASGKFCYPPPTLRTKISAAKNVCEVGKGTSVSFLP